MKQNDRLRLILKENNLRQKDFANNLKISASYISKILREDASKISPQLLELIEKKYGYCAEWITTGTEPKLKTEYSNKELSDYHKQVILRLEKMPEEQLRAVLVFIHSLEKIYESDQ
jgi:transcriptional regulator with XRE-family HTH domain